MMAMQLLHSNTVIPAVIACSAMFSSNSIAKPVDWHLPPPAYEPDARQNDILAIPHIPATAAWKSVVARRFQEALSLEADWDGLDSEAVSSEIVSLADKLLVLAFENIQHPAVPAVVPAGDGSIQLEWRLIDSRFELEISKDSSVEAWALDRSTNHSIEADGAEAISLFISWAQRLTADKFISA